MDRKRFLKNLAYFFVPSALLFTGWYIVIGDDLNRPEEHHRFYGALIQTGIIGVLIACAFEGASYLGSREAKRSYKRHGDTPMAAFGMIKELTSKRALNWDRIWDIALIIDFLFLGVMILGVAVRLLTIAPGPNIAAYKLPLLRYLGLCFIPCGVLSGFLGIRGIRRFRKNRLIDEEIRALGAEAEEDLRRFIEEGERKDPESSTKQ